MEYKVSVLSEGNTILTEKFSRWLIIIGLIMIGLTLIIFIRGENLNINNHPNTEKIGHFGDFLGGLVGSLWALAGVVLFYIALSEQKKDIKINRDALEQQIKEFELQRKELEQTRHVLELQSKTIKLQQYESSFYNLLNLFNSNVESLKYVDSGTNLGKNCFQVFVSKFHELLDIKKGERVKDIQNVKNHYMEFYNRYQSYIGHYFRTLYHIVKFVDESCPIENTKYIQIIKAQLSTYELVLLFYNCISEYGYKNFKPLIEKYQFFEHIEISKLKHNTYKDFYDSKAFNENRT